MLEFILSLFGVIAPIAGGCEPPFCGGEAISSLMEIFYK
jgi:hypothetical protein